MNWYACYTKPRAEKKSFSRLQQAGINCYLPLKKERRKWSDRLKTIYTPLFTSYIFVFIDEHEIHKVRLEGDLVGFVTFEGKAVPIPEAQIDIIKRITAAGEELDIVPADMKEGQKIEIIEGPLMGIMAELVRHQGNHKVLIRLDHLKQGVLFTIDKSFIASRLRG
jgi:transcriptional antiterminator RfaH